MARDPAHADLFLAGRRHVLAAALSSVGYVALVAARRATRFGLGEFVVCAAALALAYFSARVRVRTIAWATWGAAVVCAAIVGFTPSTRAAAAVGTFAALASGAVALARLPSPGGIVRDRKRSPRIGVALVAACFATAGIGLWGDLAWVLTAAAIASSLLLAGFAAAARLERRLELGVVERLNAFLLAIGALAAGALALGATAALPWPAVGCVLGVGCGVAATTLCELGDAIVVWNGVRRAAAIAGLAIALASAYAFLLIDQPLHARELAAAVILGGIVCGAELGRIGRALRADASRRLLAVDEAKIALRGRDAEGALAGALHALRKAAPPSVTASPELWTLDPVTILRVDAAGYARTDAGEIPPELLVIACAEAESTVRAEALTHVQVRRPDLRGLSRWMSDAKLASATLVSRGGDIEAVLFLPSWTGVSDMTLEEARALRELADELAPLCHARAQLARSMARESAARDAEGEATTRAERLEHHLARASAHHALHAARLARPAAVGIYAAQSRSAFDALERLAKAQAPAVVVARSGVDPVPFLARAHLAGARKNAPFVLVDCTAAREHDIERWRDPIASPLALADGGVLVLLDAAALPIDLQRLVGQALAERRAPWPRGDSLDIVLALTTIEAPRALADAGRLDPLLSSRAGDAIDDPLRIPGIVDRPEDIRAIVTDRLAREGLRVRGAPLGIDDAGFALLVDHPFEGEDAELSAIVQRLVAHALAEGRDVVRERDVRTVLPELVVQDGPVIPTKPTPRGTGT
jgi:hypothetical protein